MFRRVYKVMIVKDTPKPRLYNSYDNKELARNAMNSLDKKGYFTYISIETEAPHKPMLYVVPKPNLGYNGIFLKGV